MKRVLLATVAAIGLVATGAQAFQAEQPRQRQQQQRPQQQQVEKKPNEKTVNVDGWKAACCPTVVSSAICFGLPQLMSIASSGARSQPTFQCKHRPNTSW